MSVRTNRAKVKVGILKAVVIEYLKRLSQPVVAIAPNKADVRRHLRGASTIVKARIAKVKGI